MYAIGIVLCLIAGFCNGSFNIFLKPNAPESISLSLSWPWEASWLIFTIYTIFLNFLYTYAVFGPSYLHGIYSNANTLDLSLVVIFSFLWGFGTIAFGLATKYLGMALGTAILMGVVLISGTLLPMIVFGGFNTTSGNFAVCGVFIALIGLYFSAYAGIIKDEEVVGNLQIIGMNKIEKLQLESDEIKNSDNSFMSNIYSCMRNSGGSNNSPAIITLRDENDNNMNNYNNNDDDDDDNEISTFVAIIGTIIGAFLASFLQFAFVFGQSMIDDAEKRGVAPTFSPGIIWFLSFNFGSLLNFAYSIYLLYKNNTWISFQGESEDIHWYPLRCLLMSAMWMSHIHLYGASQSLLGEHGSYLSWPIVMSCTVLTGQIHSIYLGEWSIATDKAILYNIISLICLFISVVLIACGGFI